MALRWVSAVLLLAGTLAGDPAARMNGVTGRLSMDAQRKIHRVSSWMVFRDGRAEAPDETTH